jgi:hypothetical protein
MPPCNQCGKPAIISVNKNPLCVGCYARFEAATQMRDTRLKERENFLLDQAETLTGLSGVMPRHKISRPVIHAGTFNNIKIDKSTVGTLNTGYIGWIDTALTGMVKPEDADLKIALKEFTQAIVNNVALSGDAKNEVLEQATIVASQAGLPREKQMHATLKSLSAGISALIGGAADLTTLWNNIRTLLGV